MMQLLTLGKHWTKFTQLLKKLLSSTKVNNVRYTVQQGKAMTIKGYKKTEQ